MSFRSTLNPIGKPIPASRIALAATAFVQEQNGNAAACQFYFDALRQCQENSSLSAFN